jgi:purine-binding chemotaxis protein CheW
MSEALKEDPFLVELRTHLIGSYIEKVQKMRAIIEGSYLIKESFYKIWNQDFAEFSSEVEKMSWPLLAKMVADFSLLEKKLMTQRVIHPEFQNLNLYKESLINIIDTFETIFVSLEQGFNNEKWLTEKYSPDLENHRQIILNLCKTLQNSKNKKIIKNIDLEEESNSEQSAILSATLDKIYMIVNINELEIAIPIEEVQEVVNQRTITQLPDGSSEILGLINLRGDPVPILDILKVWNLSSLQSGYFLICHKKNKKFGIQVQKAEQVKVINSQKILPAKDLVGLSNKELIQGVYVENDKQILIINFNILI